MASNKTAFTLKSDKDRDEKTEEYAQIFAKIYDKVRGAKKLPAGFNDILFRTVSRTSDKDRAVLRGMSTVWKVKGDSVEHEQRGPAAWVDQMLFFQSPWDDEPSVAIGVQSKVFEHYGQPEKVEGLVLGGGGHYERCGFRKRKTDNRGLIINYESHPGMVAALNSEMLEELYVSPKDIISTVPLMAEDDPTADGTQHGIRYIFMRFSRAAAKPSEELKSVQMMKLSELRAVLAGKKVISVKDPATGKEKVLDFIRGHGDMLRMLLSLDRVADYLTAIHQYTEHIRSWEGRGEAAPGGPVDDGMDRMDRP